MGLFQWLASLLDQLVININMGRYQWVSSLFDQLIAWLGEVVTNFVRKLIENIKRDWNKLILPTLISAFTVEAIVLYTIFYAGPVVGQTIMEIWDARYFDTKESQVFILKEAPQDTPLSTNRSEAKILQLENWN